MGSDCNACGLTKRVESRDRVTTRRSGPLSHVPRPTRSQPLPHEARAQRLLALLPPSRDAKRSSLAENWISFAMLHVALWESKSQIAGLACQDNRYIGPASGQADRAPTLENNQSTHNFISARGHPLVRHFVMLAPWHGKIPTFFPLQKVAAADCRCSKF